MGISPGFYYMHRLFSELNRPLFLNNDPNIKKAFGNIWEKFLLIRKGPNLCDEGSNKLFPALSHYTSLNNYN